MARSFGQDQVDQKDGFEDRLKSGGTSLADKEAKVRPTVDFVPTAETCH